MPEEDNQEDFSSLEEIKQELEECQKQKEEYLKGWQRERADFINYKKKEKERIEELVRYADNGLLMKFLPVLDHFNVAEKQLPEELIENDHIQGLLQIKKQLKDIFAKQGVEEIDCVGKNFDPNLHEAVEMIKKDDLEGGEKEGWESGVVVEEVRKGYIKDGNVLRASKVKVLK